MKLVLIGSSTGGPGQLRFLLEDLDIKDTCIIIAQHMTEKFLPSFIEQFDKNSKSSVCTLEDKEILSNKIYICCKNTILKGQVKITANWSDLPSDFNPSVDLLFNSAVDLVKSNTILAVILTGMGDDGAESLLKLHKAGVKCIGENQEDCVVFGMPKRARQLNPDLKLMSLKDIKKEILSFIEDENLNH